MITEEMTDDCLWLSQQGDAKRGKADGRLLIIDADWTALEIEDGSVRVDIFTYLACVLHGRDIRQIIAQGPFQNFLFFKDRWNIDGGFYQDLADIDDILTDAPHMHDQITCADYAKTLMGYIQSGGKKRIDWGWLDCKLNVAE